MTNSDIAFGSEMRAPGNTSKKNRRVVKIVALLVVLALLALVAGFGVLLKYRDEHRRFYIPSASMEPTLKTGDRVSTNKLSSTAPIERGEIVITNPPPTYPNGSVTHIVKRVVGLPGETIEAKSGAVYINDKRLSESYVDTPTTDIPRTMIPANNYYMLGDNRTDSLDSRMFGPVQRDLITNKVTAIVSPKSHKAKF